MNTHANTQNISKLRKHLLQFDPTRAAFIGLTANSLQHLVPLLLLLGVFGGVFL
jgi:hypothetical protein